MWRSWANIQEEWFIVNQEVWLMVNQTEWLMVNQEECLIVDQEECLIVNQEECLMVIQEEWFMVIQEDDLAFINWNGHGNGMTWAHGVDSPRTIYRTQCCAQFAYWTGLGTCDARLCALDTLQSVLESGQQARIVQIDFYAAVDRVNHQGILYKLCFVCIGGSVLSILIQFLSNQSQHVMVDSCRSKLVNVLSEVLQLDQCFGLLLFLLNTSKLFTFWRISSSVMPIMTPLW